MIHHTFLVTGGLGFLGQFVVKGLLDAYPLCRVRILDYRPQETFLGIERLPGVQVMLGDLRQPYACVEALDGVDAVIHCAGLITCRSGQEQHLLQTNVQGTRNLLQAALRQDCPDFVFISSISAVACQSGVLANESMMPDLQEKRENDLYGYSKMRCEDMLRAQSYRIRAIILNPSVIIGPGSALIAKLLAYLRWTPICPMLANVNSFVDVRDVAKAAVLGLSSGRSGERYIVTTTNVDQLTLMRAIVHIMHKRSPVIPISDGWLHRYDILLALVSSLGWNPGLRPAKNYKVDKQFSAQKISLEMGWQPDYTLEESLQYVLQAEMGAGKREPRWPYRLAHRGF